MNTLITKLLMSNLYGILLLGFAWFTNVELGDMSWLKYVVPYVCGLIIYIVYNRYNSRRKYDLAEMSLATKTLKETISEQKLKIKVLEEAIERIRKEKEDWMMKSLTRKP